MLKAIIIGNLGNDPDEPRYTADGRPFVRFNVASTYRGRGQDGESQDKTEWIRVTVFGRQAEVVTQYLHKGSRVYVEGRLETRPWTDNQQQPRAGLEMLANDVQFMSNRSDDEAGGSARTSAPSGAGSEPRGSGGSEARSSGGGYNQAPRSSGPKPQPAPSEDAELEDLPF